jgi:hypothetical protein
MIYQISTQQTDYLVSAIVSYYQEAWDKGVRGLFDNMARSKMGKATAAIDQAKDVYASLRKESNDKFGVKFRGELERAARLYVAHNQMPFEIGTLLVTQGEAALKKLTVMIPVPVVGSVIDKMVSMAADEARSQIHTASLNAADNAVAKSTGAVPDRFFTDDWEAEECVKETMKLYKYISRFVPTLPPVLTSFDDIVAYPEALFTLQKTASTMNVQLQSLKQYVRAMEARHEQIQEFYQSGIAKLKESVSVPVGKLLQSEYDDAFRKGKLDATQYKYVTPVRPEWPAVAGKGGATLLADYLVHAFAQGYFDAGDPSVISGRSRSNAVVGRPTPPVPPPRPVWNRAVPTAQTPPPLPPRPLKG